MLHRAFVVRATVPITLLLAAGCAPRSAAARAGAPDSINAGAAVNTLTAAERAAGWRLLFDGRTTAGWRVYGKESTGRWLVENGSLVGLGVGEDLVSEAEFTSFDLSLEWKLAPRGNSGIFFHVVDDPARYAGVHLTGPEYQIIDDEGWPGRLEEWQKTGANYAMHTTEVRPTRPVGEWNQSRLVVRGPRVEHWLNGTKLLEYDLWTAEWERRVREGKWKDVPDYGRARRGRIALQDHGARVEFRNVKIRPLP